jgi:uncharacterized membrane protein YesL
MFSHVTMNQKNIKKGERHALIRKIIFNAIFQIIIWIYRIIYLNVLWIVFTLLGLGLFGMGPATASLFTIERKWLLGEAKYTHIFKTFWLHYKNDFIKTNIMGIPIIIIGLILFADFHIVFKLPGIWRFVLYMITLAISFLYLLTLVFLFPVFVHYNMKTTGQYLKNALLIGISQIMIFIKLSLCLAVVGLLFWGIPVLAPLLGVSLCGLIIMWNANRAFEKIKLRQFSLQVKNFVGKEKYNHNVFTAASKDTP